MNDLERSLQLAANDPTERPGFYRELLRASVFVVNTANQPLDAHNGVAKEETTIAITPVRLADKEWLPFFTSLPRLQAVIQHEAMYLQLGARDFFEMTRGSDLVLNPTLEFGKEFLAQEVEGLLDGSLFTPTEEHHVPADTQVLLGQPSVYPGDLVKALSRLLANHSSVRAAFLAQVHDPSSGLPPHLLIGIDSESDPQRVIGECSLVSKDFLNGDEIIDFMRVECGDTGLGQYLQNETKPFYRRSRWRSWLPF